MEAEDIYERDEKELSGCLNYGCYFKVDHSNKGPIRTEALEMWNIKYDMEGVHRAYLSAKDALIPLLALQNFPRN